MSKIFIDPITFQCHTTQNNEGTRIPYESVWTTAFFSGKCDTFIEGHRVVPDGKSWTREDGTVFTGEMIAPWKDYDELDATQRSYEQQLLAEYKIKENELNDSYQEGVNSI